MIQNSCFHGNSHNAFSLCVALDRSLPNDCVDIEQLCECVIGCVVGWCHGERMRDGERGWFPANCATQITNRTAMENNIQRMERLRKETDV